MSRQPSHGANDDAERSYDALLYLSFGGPEGPDDVMPFLEHVTRGRGVPRERLEEVAEHYMLFDGVSPINDQNRAVIEALEEKIDLPIYWGNRNSEPFITDTMQRMADNGVKRAICFVTSAFSSYSGCRQYREDIALAQEAVGAAAPQVDKLRVFFNHPGFIEPQTEKVIAALDQAAEARLVFTAHSVPVSMAETSSYVDQLREAARLVSEGSGGKEWDLVYQSRSGPPQVPWLEPDIADHLEELAAEGVRDVVVVPIGFVSDHMEVKFDLDVEAAEVAERLGLNMVRAGTVGDDPKYIDMIVELVEERMTADPERRTLGSLPPSHDVCARDCCPVRSPAS